MPRLKMIRGPEPGKVYDLTDDVIVIGRGRKNEIIVHDNEVSRHHARLQRVLDDYEIHDAGSTNGTFVDGHRVGEGGWMLHSNCIIELGDSITFQYKQDSLSPEKSDDMLDKLKDKRHPFLVVKLASNEGEEQIYTLLEEGIELGRDLETNHIILQEAEVSRRHIRLTQNRTGYTIEDLGSMNGTLINDKPLEPEDPHQLHTDDVITIGTTVHMVYVDKASKRYDEIHEQILPGELDEPSTSKRLRTPLDDSSIIKRTTSSVQSLGSGLQEGDLFDFIFLASAREDWEDAVGHLFVYLEDHEIPVWSDQYLEPESDDWRKAHEQALMECKALVVVISPSAMQSNYVMPSIRHFINREKPIVLVQYQKVDRLPMSIQNLPIIQYNLMNPEKSFRTIYEEIMRKVRE